MPRSVRRRARCWRRRRKWIEIGFRDESSPSASHSAKRESRAEGESELKHAVKFAGIGLMVAGLVAVAASQENRVYRQGSNWAQELSGSLSGAKNLRVKVDNGSVRVEGGS